MSVVVASSGQVQPARPGDPARIGPYRIIGRLGAGGMGTVHAGLDPAGTRVAVKVVHAMQAQDSEFRARFRREVQLSARVQGPCLIPLLAADTEADAPWLATEYAPGLTLNDHLTAHGPLTGGMLYAFAAGTAQALAAVHGAGVVHRDVKPQNVILTPGGPRVLDFGIAHAVDGTSVTRTGVMTGTPGWISPEHYRTGSAGPESDMFGWGALVAYAATGRLPFGSGAPDVVAFRVLSGDPDLDGVGPELRDILERALRKDSATRITAASAADESLVLLAAQSTQVLGAGTSPEPTLVGELVSAEWQMPTIDDPTWHAPQPVVRRRAVTAVLVAGALVGGLVGGALALRPGDSEGGGGAETFASDRAGLSGGGDQVGGGSGGGGAATPAPPSDPREARIPKDPLAGVANPAYTRATDDAQPSSAEWRASSSSSDEEEKDAAQAVLADMRTMLATKNMDFMEPTVTFNKRAQTMMVTGGPIPQIPEENLEVFRRAAEMAMCSASAHRLKDHPSTWPYGRYSVHWKWGETDPEPIILGFGQATSGCFNEVAGRWQGDDLGIATARIPSADQNEIRVADDADKAITAAWDAAVAEGNGNEPFATNDVINLGFDPVEKAAYVWASDSSGVLIGRAQRSNFQGVTSSTLCPKMLAEYKANKSWNYTRWSVAVYPAGEAEPEIISSGICTP
ncbi:serine/threonine-protein kinase [Streptomyces prasinus]|uniref:serine/threonine-protein kinase n=1 Tax=Streptomyces prasinus TaxID=67345 RepID=UPI0036B2E153